MTPLIGSDSEALKLHMLRERDRATMHLRPLMENTIVEAATEWISRLVGETEEPDTFISLRAYFAIYGLQTAILEACGMELLEPDPALNTAQTETGAETRKET